MAENLTQFRAGSELLQLLQRQGLPKEAVQLVADKVAELLKEARTAAAGGQLTKQQAPKQLQQLGQQQKPQGAPAAAAAVQQQQRDLSAAEAVLQGVSCILPRGKFDVGFFEDGLQLSNKQTWASVPYGGIEHCLVIDAIPKQPNTTNIVLVMKSGQEVQQGKNRLELVVMQTKDRPELDLPAPPACAHLGERLSGPAAVVLSQLLASFMVDVGERTFLTAEPSVFSSSSGDLMVAANRGASPGWLVPLSAGLCYIGRPGTFLPAAAIAKVHFHRAGGGSSTFDVTVRLRGGGGGRPLELGQIDAAELAKLQGYCLAQRIRMGDGSDEEEDEGGEGAAGGGAAAATAARGGGGGGAGAGGGADDDDDDEEDDDYDPQAAERSSKRQRLGAGGSDQEEEGEDEEEEEEEGDGGSGEESSDVSLVDEDAMDEDEDED